MMVGGVSRAPGGGGEVGEQQGCSLGHALSDYIHFDGQKVELPNIFWGVQRGMFEISYIFSRLDIFSAMACGNWSWRKSPEMEFALTGWRGSRGGVIMLRAGNPRQVWLTCGAWRTGA